MHHVYESGTYLYARIRTSVMVHFVENSAGTHDERTGVLLIATYSELVNPVHERDYRNKIFCSTSFPSYQVFLHILVRCVLEFGGTT